MLISCEKMRNMMLETVRLDHSDRFFATTYTDAQNFVVWCSPLTGMCYFSDTFGY